MKNINLAQRHCGVCVSAVVYIVFPAGDISTTSDHPALFQIINASYKNREDLIRFINSLNDNGKWDSDVDVSNNDDGEQGQVENIDDLEKEKKLQRILWLLKKNNNAETQYKKLQGPPKSPRFFIISNPEVLEDFKKYIRNKNALNNNNDLSSDELNLRRNAILKELIKSKGSGARAKKSKHKKSIPKQIEPDTLQSEFQEESTPVVVAVSKKPKKHKKRLPIQSSEADIPEGEANVNSNANDMGYLEVPKENKKHKKPMPVVSNKLEMPKSEPENYVGDMGTDIGTNLGSPSKHNKPKSKPKPKTNNERDAPETMFHKDQPLNNYNDRIDKKRLKKVKSGREVPKHNNDRPIKNKKNEDKPRKREPDYVEDKPMNKKNLYDDDKPRKRVPQYNEDMPMNKNNDYDKSIQRDFPKFDPPRPMNKKNVRDDDKPIKRPPKYDDDGPMHKKTDYNKPRQRDFPKFEPPRPKIKKIDYDENRNFGSNMKDNSWNSYKPKNNYRDYGSNYGSRNKNIGRNQYGQGRTPIPYVGNRNIYERD